MAAQDSAADADNTGHNKRDQAEQTLTPTDQSQDPKDIKLAANVRKALMDDESLSMLAKNIKVMAEDGEVTLRGPVKTQQEKMQAEKSAKKAGAKQVDNQLEIKKNNE